ncbi:2'-deoxycytidine 5'-triphosphate deaminase [Parvularcula sp. LCG005]|uniref:2'-deoxycytidine 5'-triphosphate deaminase n=1 Tax=Parvularcula sp. LCG005 TaxID=3078805 RepID=UPI0029429A15|nr:2'-deoxycytidine 5'-triphosphate deaminase [Parvularcula sp. LCG005]WOI52878.1 2'-deoxycytidine 5'-triphosphate deaminase [Parvularcula sp. LCG005]
MSTRSFADGVFTAADLRSAMNAGLLHLGASPTASQVQPASLDLTLGDAAWRVRAAFLPGAKRTVEERLADGLALHRLDLRDGAVLEKGCVYLVRLRESLALSPDLLARANPKSSTGRIDVFVRLVTDRGVAYDSVPAGYKGPLYAEISPRTFSILVCEGSSLNQLRLRKGHAVLSDDDLRARQSRGELVSGKGWSIGGGLCLSVDLGDSFGPVVGYRARRHSALIDVDRIAGLNPDDYWEPIPRPASGFMILDPDEFYILASQEELKIPSDLAAEMLPIDTDLGAFRVHYAGFFDPGFGVEQGSRAVLEIRGYDAPFVLEHGQTVARLVYEQLTGPPDVGYGAGLASNYQGQGLRLSKHFRM